MDDGKLGDRLALALLVGLPVLVGLVDHRRPNGDLVTLFLPAYAFLGDQLRNGTLPGWNPHQFGGMPFAGDPQLGWMYLPAMLLFTLLPTVAAIAAWAVGHVILGGARSLSSPAGSDWGRRGRWLPAWPISLPGCMSVR